MSRQNRRATYEDLLAVPENKVAEIIDGELFVSPRPATPHAWATSVIIQDVGSFDRKPDDPTARRGWWVLVEPEIHFAADVLVPDLAAWRRERLPAVPNAPYVTLAPDWACEVISPSTGRLDRSRKMGVYAREGVAWLWLVDPLAYTLEVYQLDAASRWMVAATFGGWDTVRAEPFEILPLDLSRWWLDPPPASPTT